MKPSKDSRVIILIGPPGSGKGTQAELISDKLNLYYLETSKILEEKFKEAESSQVAEKRYLEIGGKKYSILQEKEIWKKGILCSPPFVAYLIQLKIREIFDFGKNLILAGSPRTLDEAKEVAPLLKKLYGMENIRVILLELSPKETYWRNTHRRICELMRHPILFTKETEKLKKCPLDGSLLMRRKGLDDPKTIETRLKEYRERTLPLIEYFKSQGLKIQNVNGDQPVADVFEDILRKIKK